MDLEVLKMKISSYRTSSGRITTLPDDLLCEILTYNLEIGSIGCRVMATAYDQGVFTGVADPRDIGTSWAK